MLFHGADVMDSLVKWVIFIDLFPIGELKVLVVWMGYHRGEFDITYHDPLIDANIRQASAPI